MNRFKQFWKSLREPLSSTKPQAKSWSPTYSNEDLGSFTPRAQQVLALARQEADRFNHNFIGTEDLLLGLIALGQGVAFNVLEKFGLNLQTVRAEVEKFVGSGPDKNALGHIPYTPRVKKVLALAAKEARALNHTYVGTEHILLGLLRDGDGAAARVLLSFDVDIETTRREILRELDPNYHPGTTKTGSTKPEPAVADSPNYGSERKVNLSKAYLETIDLSKRYDVYCSERNQELIVYRSARFVGIKRLFNEVADRMADFYELEQPDGQKNFVAKYSVVKFCEQGGTPGGESVPGETP